VIGSACGKLNDFSLFHVLCRRASRTWPERNRRNFMKSLAKKVQRFLVSEDGPTAVEYAVMLALIVIVCLTAIQAIGTNASATFQEVADQIGSTT
jgi:pilus assembly protein Flp/PilA